MVSTRRSSFKDCCWQVRPLPTAERWEFGEVAEVSVLQPQGLAAGAHEVAVGVQLRISYLPWSPVTNCSRTETIAA